MCFHGLKFLFRLADAIFLALIVSSTNHLKPRSREEFPTTFMSLDTWWMRNWNVEGLRGAHYVLVLYFIVCVRACVRADVRACARARACACMGVCMCVCVYMLLGKQAVAIIHHVP